MGGGGGGNRQLRGGGSQHVHTCWNIGYKKGPRFHVNTERQYSITMDDGSLSRRQ